MAHKNQGQDFSTRDFIAVLLIIFNPPAAMVFAAVASMGNLITWADERSSRPKSPKPAPHVWQAKEVLLILVMLLIIAAPFAGLIYDHAH